MGPISRVSSRTYRETVKIMQTSNFQAMKFTSQKWAGGPSWSTLPKSHLPDSKVWTIKGTPFEKLDINLKKQGTGFRGLGTRSGFTTFTSRTGLLSRRWVGILCQVFVCFWRTKWQKSLTTESPAKTTHTSSRLDTSSHR